MTAAPSDSDHPRGEGGVYRYRVALAESAEAVPQVTFERHVYAAQPDLQAFAEGDHVLLVFAAEPIALLQTIGDRTVTARKMPETVCILCGPVSGHGRVLSGRSEVLQVRLPHQMMADAAAVLGLCYRPGLVQPQFCKPDAPLAGLGRSLLAEIAEGDRADRLLFESYGHAFASFVLSRYVERREEAPVPFRGGLTGRMLRTVREYVAQHYAGEPTVADLASCIGLSTFHFCREFKRSTGLTPYQYVVKVRCEAAMGLLSAGETSVTAIAMTCGFGSPQSFARTFRKVVGMSPTEYRRAAAS